MALDEPLPVRERFRAWMSRTARWHAIAFLLIAVGTSAAYAIVWAVAGRRIRVADILVLRALHARSSLALDVLAISFTALGVSGVNVLVTAAVVAVLARHRRLEDAFEVIAGVAACIMLATIVKWIFREPRPDVFHPIVPASGYAFPSGHAALGAFLYPFVGVLLWTSETASVRRKLLALLVPFVGIGMMWSRLYLGVHWLEDVAGGASMGFAWLAVALGARRSTRARE